MEKIGLKRTEKLFSVEFSLINNNNILDTHKYLMQGT